MDCPICETTVAVAVDAAQTTYTENERLEHIICQVCGHLFVVNHYPIGKWVRTTRVG